MAYRILKPDFYQRDARVVARELLGKYLTVEQGGGKLSFPITETEAYIGPHDLACHAAKGRTKRTEVMFCEGGVWYVYFVYGLHWMLNIVTGEKEYPAAVLIRGIEGVNGPARLTKFLNITNAYNGLPATKKTSLYVEDRGVAISRLKIKSTPRIGVDFAGPIWSQKPYRFLLQ